jgi:sugar lactone lactonase YvrE
MRRLALTSLATTVAFLAGAAPALAVPDCPGYTQAPRVLLSGRGTLESVIVDRQGRLYFTDVSAGELLRMNSPTAKPKPVVKNLSSPGGLAWDHGKLIVGYGDSVATASSVNPVAGLVLFNPKNGKSRPLATGTQMSNGVARGPNGAIYASSDVGTGIDRVIGGNVEINWAQLASPNGLAVSRNGRWLYANQTFVPAQISRIEIADPSNVQVYAAPAPADNAAGLDGMTRDASGNLYVAANGGGAVWRVARDRSICALGSGFGLTSAVALGHGRRGFSRHNLYAVNFNGELIELPHVR